MAKRRRSFELKLRTREHILEDLSINYLERRIFEQGYAVAYTVADYGIDVSMLTFSDSGEVERGHVFFQVKATDSLKVLKDQQTISTRVEVADLKAWQEELSPVILVVYDGQHDKAYWLDVQEYLEAKRVSVDDLSIDQDRITLRLTKKNQLSRRSIAQFRQLRTLRWQQSIDRYKKRGENR